MNRRQHLSPSGDHRLVPAHTAAWSPPLPRLREGLRQAAQALAGALHGSHRLWSRRLALGQPQGRLQRLAHTEIPCAVRRIFQGSPLSPLLFVLASSLHARQLATSRPQPPRWPAFTNLNFWWRGGRTLAYQPVLHPAASTSTACRSALLADDRRGSLPQVWTACGRDFA